MKVPMRKAAVSILLGNMLEHYDTALFSFAGAFLAPLFFPNNNPIVALIMTYAIIPAGMVIRPISALYFGYIGDKYGRKRALTLSLFGMAVSTGLIGFIPIYHSIGIFAPLLLLVGRLMQNFFAEGEKMGGAIFLLEQDSEENKQDMISSIFQVSTIVGILLASFLVALFSYFDLMGNYWRVLYFFGFMTALFASLLRQGLDVKEEGNSYATTNYLERLKSFWDLRRATVPIAVAAGFSYACYSMAFVLMTGFVPLVTSITKAEMMELNTLFLVVDMAMLPLFGYLARYLPRKTIMVTAAAVAACFGIPLTYLITNGTIGSAILLRGAIVTIGVAFSASFHAWAKELVPQEKRYLLLSFSNSLGTQLFGGGTVVISLWLYQQTGQISSVAWYWVLLAFATTYSVMQSHPYLAAATDISKRARQQKAASLTQS